MSGKSPGAYLWTPRLHPYEEDAQLWQEEPIKSTFTARQHEPTRSNFIEDAWDWFAFCIGEDVTNRIPEDAMDQMLDDMLSVLYLQYSHAGGETGETLALDLLLRCQMSNFRNYHDMPAPEYCWMDDLECCEGDLNFDSDSDTDSGSDVSMSGPDDDDDNDEDYVPDFSQSSAFPAPLALPERPPLSGTLEELTQLPYLWVRHMKVFFYLQTNPKICRSKTDIVNDIVDMRNLPKHVWKSSAFQTALEVDSDQLATLHKISQAGNLLETSHPDVEQSFRFHNWKQSYRELICKWTPRTISPEEYEAQKPKSDPNYRFTGEDALNLLNFIIPAYQGLGSGQSLPQCHAATPAGQPQHPSSQGFLKGLHRKLAIVIQETSAHRTLMRKVKKQVWRPNLSNADVSESESASEAESIPKPHDQSQLSKGAKRNAKKREKQKKQDRTAVQARRKAERLEAEMLGAEWEPEEQFHCTTCTNEDDKCVREIQVFERPDAKSLIGVALTCAPPGDRLSPCATPTNGAIPTVRYVNPVQLGLTWIGPRNTHARCGRDITRFYFIHENGEVEWVGGVRYNAMRKKLLNRLIDNHRRVKICSVCRREAMQAWAYGSMTGHGSRQGQGGLRGDTYGPYAHHKGDSPDDIRALFRHAFDTEVLVEIGTTIVPALHSDIIAVSKAAEVHRLGRYGITSFYYSNYISAVHPDFDFGKEDLKRESGSPNKGKGKPELLVQSGTNKSLHEWDFALVRFGIVIETHSNMVWCFNGRHEHGSVHPSHSSYHNGAMSLGYHPTMRKTDVEHAEFHRQIQFEMNLRPCKV
ncbi:hypothetical protein FB451DRAFT_1165235 [Mycena latifolia]|nr:hypothetical protein FB451DRAFT_1165235 [Mycena latifolia]